MDNSRELRRRRTGKLAKEPRKPASKPALRTSSKLSRVTKTTRIAQTARHNEIICEGLPIRLRNLDDSLRQKKEGGISAIGILGSDVFDKLLVLRALEPKFPEAVFFTTDFDASLTLPSELDFTRNLIISSSFGPELRPEIQGEIPPFRSSYQTAAFLATSLAVGATRDGREPSFDQEKISAWLSPSRIFEIGRTGDIIQYAGKAADFPAGTPQNRDHKSPAYVAQNTAPIDEGRSTASPASSKATVENIPPPAADAQDNACGRDLLACGDVQPPIDKLFSEAGKSRFDLCDFGSHFDFHFADALSVAACASAPASKLADCGFDYRRRRRRLLQLGKARQLADGIWRWRADGLAARRQRLADGPAARAGCCAVRLPPLEGVAQTG